MQGVLPSLRVTEAAAQGQQGCLDTAFCNIIVRILTLDLSVCASDLAQCLPRLSLEFLHPKSNGKSERDSSSFTIQTPCCQGLVPMQEKDPWTSAPCLGVHLGELVMYQVGREIRLPPGSRDTVSLSRAALSLHTKAPLLMRLLSPSALSCPWSHPAGDCCTFFSPNQ